MQVNLTPEQEARLSRIATHAGHGVDDLVRRVLDLYLAHEPNIKIDPSLLFDEADALFGKRSQAQDSQERYADQDPNTPGKP